MKNIITFLFILVAQSSFSQLWYKKPTNDRSDMRLYGNVKSISITEFFVTTTNGITQNGKMNSNESYTFDMEGRKIKYVSTVFIQKKEDYFYGVLGNIIEKDNYTIDNKLINKVKYEYDEKGNMIDDHSGNAFIYGKDYNEVKQLEKIQSNGYQTLFKYDNNGNQLERADHDNRGIGSQLSTSIYDNLGNEIESDAYRNGNSEIITQRNIFKYDGRNKTEWTQYDYQNSLGGHGYYKYDNRGNEIEFKWFNPDGSLRYTSTSKYDFDKNSNWIRRYEYHDGVPTFFTERKITYYNTPQHVAQVKLKSNTVHIENTDEPFAILAPDEMQFPVIFYDNFNENKNSWPIQNNANLNFLLEDHRFKMQSSASEAVEPVVITNVSSDNDWYILSGMTHIMGDPDASFGLAFAYNDGGNFYTFEINANGRYRVCRVLDNQFYVILPWTFSDKIVKGDNHRNFLKVRYQGGPVCEFYVNGNLVDHIDNFQPGGVYTGYVIQGKQSIEAQSLIIGKRNI